MLNTFFSKSIFACMFFCVTHVNAKNQSMQAPLEKLKAAQLKYQSMKTFRLQFKQKLFPFPPLTEEDKKGRESSGQIFVKMPNQFRWETHQPKPSVLMSNGKKVWYYVHPESAQAAGKLWEHEAKRTHAHLILDILTGKANYASQFMTKYDEASGSFILEPKKPIGDIKKAEVFLVNSTNLVYKVVLTTLVGNKTELELSNLSSGLPLKESMFRFAPTSGQRIEKMQ